MVSCSESNDDPDQTRKDPQYNYYSYVLLFRDVIYNGGGNTLPINLSYLDTSKPLQQFSVTLASAWTKTRPPHRTSSSAPPIMVTP